MKNFSFPLLALLAPLTAEAAFNPAHVSADARWVVHVDVAALRDTTMGQTLLAAANDFAPMLEQGGLQPDIPKILATLGTITAYGASFSQDPTQMDGTLVIQGSPELRKIAEGFIAQATITQPEQIVELEGLPFEAYTLNGQATIAFPAEQVILFSKSQEQLTRSYDILQGRAASLARSKQSPLHALLPDAGSPFLLAASMVPAGEDFLAAPGPHSRILKMVTAGSIAIGESRSMTSARLLLEASNDEMADKLDRILQGMTAILSLTNSSDARLKEFLQSVTTKRDGHQVSLSLAYPTERLLEMAESFRHQVEAPRTPRAGGSTQGNPPPAPPASIEGMGEVIGTWRADADQGSDAPTSHTLASRSFDGVHLQPGAMITISGRRGGGEHARIDYLELLPTDGSGAALRQEAEFMRLENFQIERFDFVSGGELVRLTNHHEGRVRFQFQGLAGTYRITVGYVDETDGQSSFALGVQNPVAGGVATP